MKKYIINEFDSDLTYGYERVARVEEEGKNTEIQVSMI